MKINFRKNNFIIPWQFVKINIIAMHVYVLRDHIMAVTIISSAKHK